MRTLTDKQGGVAVCISGGERRWKAGRWGEVKGKEWEVRITAEGNDISRGDVKGVGKEGRLGEEGGGESEKRERYGVEQ